MNEADDFDLQAGGLGMSDAEVKAFTNAWAADPETIQRLREQLKDKVWEHRYMSVPVEAARCPVTGKEVVRDPKHFGEPVVVPYVGIGRVIEPPPAPEKPSTVRMYDPSKVRMSFNGIPFEGFVSHDNVLDVDTHKLVPAAATAGQSWTIEFVQTSDDSVSEMIDELDRKVAASCAVPDVVVTGEDGSRTLHDVKFVARLEGAVRSYVFTASIPKRCLRKWRRKKRMELRRRRGRGACSA